MKAGSKQGEGLSFQSTSTRFYSTTFIEMPLISFIFSDLAFKLEGDIKIGSYPKTASLDKVLATTSNQGF